MRGVGSSLLKDLLALNRLSGIAEVFQNFTIRLHEFFNVCGGILVESGYLLKPLSEHGQGEMVDN